MTVLQISKNMTPTDISISQLSVWVTYLVVGMLATICSLIYLRNDKNIEMTDDNMTKIDRRATEKDESLSSLTNHLNEILSNLSEISYETGSDFDVAYDNVLNELENFLDDEGGLRDTISSSELKYIISQFEGVIDNAKEV